NFHSSTEKALEFASRTFYNFQNYSSSLSSPLPIHSIVDSKWIPPSIGKLKMNSDAGSYAIQMGVLQAELMDIREGLLLASNLVLESIETNFLQAASAINFYLTTGVDGVLVSDIIALLTLIGGASYCHISRDINEAAHSLAKIGLDFSVCVIGDGTLALLIFV
ncbi:hypothetical protein TorRG33x02_005080, partial [Trema orientale]